MGNDSSSHQFDGCTTLGYRVLGVQPNSPASRSGLVSFFDFLVGVNGQLLFDNGEHGDGNGDFFEDLDFISILKDHCDKEVELLVWNIKSKSQRFINLTPTRNWAGTGLLGVTIRMDDYMTAEENLLRILDIQAGSPAAMAGLEPQVNYLLGTVTESFENEEILGEVLYEHEDQVLEVYVYNTKSDIVRIVTLLPSFKWGGEGLLGAEVGRGYLHRLPNSCRDTLGVSFEREVNGSDADDFAKIDERKGNNVQNDEKDNIQEILTEQSNTTEEESKDSNSNATMVDPARSDGTELKLDLDATDDHYTTNELESDSVTQLSSLSLATSLPAPPIVPVEDN